MVEDINIFKEGKSSQPWKNRQRIAIKTDAVSSLLRLLLRKNKFLANSHLISLCREMGIPNLERDAGGSGG